MAMTVRYVTSDAPTYEVITLDVSPATDWAVDDVVTGQTSAKTCTVVIKLTATTYVVKSRNGTYTLGEVVGVTGNADKLADQGAANPTFANVDGSSSTYPWTWTQALASAAAGDLVKIASGTYNRGTETTAPTNSGTITSPIAFVGCDSSWNILTPARANGHGALSTTNMPVLSYTTGYLFMIKSFLVLRNLNVASAATTQAVYAYSSNLLINCIVTASGAGADGIYMYRPYGGAVVECDIFKTASSGAGYCINFETGYGGEIVGNRLVTSGGNTGGGVSHAGPVVGNLIDVYGHCIVMSYASTFMCIVGNTLLSSNGNAVYIADGMIYPICIVNNQITDCGGYCVNFFDADEGGILFRNRNTRLTSGWTSGGANYVEVASLFNVATANADADAEYIDDASKDYRLRPASYGKEAGIFASDCGAFQRVSPTLPAVANVENAVAYGDPSPDNLVGTLVAGGGLIATRRSTLIGR